LTLATADPVRTGGTGGDTMAGDGGPDVFRLAAGLGTTDRMPDSDRAADRLDSRGHARAARLADLVIVQNAAGAVVRDPAGQRAFLSGLDADDRGAAQFLFRGRLDGPAPAPHRWARTRREPSPCPPRPPASAGPPTSSRSS
jgi:hypothetical protein